MGELREDVRLGFEGDDPALLANPDGHDARHVADVGAHIHGQLTRFEQTMNGLTHPQVIESRPGDTGADHLTRAEADLQAPWKHDGFELSSAGREPAGAKKATEQLRGPEDI